MFGLAAPRTARSNMTARSKASCPTSTTNISTGRCTRGRAMGSGQGLRGATGWETASGSLFEGTGQLYLFLGKHESCALVFFGMVTIKQANGHWAVQICSRKNYLSGIYIVHTDSADIAVGLSIATGRGTLQLQRLDLVTSGRHIMGAGEFQLFSLNVQQSLPANIDLKSFVQLHLIDGPAGKMKTQILI